MIINLTACCDICYDEDLIGLSCDSKTCDVSICYKCFLQYLKSKDISNLHSLFTSTCEVKCYNNNCNGCFGRFDLANQLSKAEFSSFIKEWNKLYSLYVEKKTIEENISSSSSSSSVASSSSSASDAITSKLINNISDLLTLKCPHCETAFTEYEGCLAVTCRFCTKSFCALHMSKQKCFCNHTYMIATDWQKNIQLHHISRLTDFFKYNNELLTHIDSIEPLLSVNNLRYEKNKFEIGKATTKSNNKKRKAEEAEPQNNNRRRRRRRQENV